MTPFWSDDHLTLYGGDCRAVLAELPAESVHCVVTSPPYWGLRDYGVGGQLGLEATPEEFVANMVAVFREVRRVLRKDGTLWLNLGDSYATKPQGHSAEWIARTGGNMGLNARNPTTHHQTQLPPGLGAKQLVGIPWRVAFALQADGWYLRSDIIWAKPNPMPESVTDRPTKAHEYLFLLTKSPRYYYDSEAVRLPISPYNQGIISVAPHGSHVAAEGHRKQETRQYDEIKGANLRTVWSIATEPYPGAHFATFPRKLVEPCVKAGTSERGVCPECGAPWVRTTSVEYVKSPVHGNGSVIGRHEASGANGWDGAGLPRLNKEVTTTGWRSSCAHEAEPVPAVVLDPFAGSGTTLFVAQALGRRGIGIDLSPEYLEQALARNKQTPLGLVG